ncbi:MULTISPECIES: FtsH protease activity modulator HflK [Pseudothermotoga]|jgi:membrane protease subunit HflK|uniref:Protein HflK n=1 Tax=Pseudothermotoga lettingae (strain ATCC BAA-301 / DSM 14385 / NBRC 107922 / TMO) TaxID=416591 RepID=A8F5V7_PSELT|nr:MULTISPECIES: FtsH protease activity modulator HflK [Pseudothermotoga]ABV33541.1 HflK protein [Pseudothermotoga lettingae TMO]KUK20932.1 MAG: HflK protein [Pseudothermotoga lettingae]MDI3495274.1 modulator of FtsH protease HflK [Pseudothermotoga sp.]MDK2883811.1 modulator of FtsH protease HflK [Pseudothermotoga sp.]GLI49545.1 HflK protein [Pseudothermotoga lettingae TMO]
MKTKVIVLVIVVVALFLYLATGVYQVNPSQVALVKTFGKYSHTSGPGIHFHAPFPFQTHVIVDVQTVRKQEIGFRTVRPGQYVQKQDEALILTKDGNIVSVEAVVQYRVNDPIKFVFNVENPEELVKFTTESALRDRISKRTVDDILTSERDTVAYETHQIAQQLLDQYDVGVTVLNVLLQEVVPPQPVIAAFDDVNNAKQDKERYINEATKYANNLIPSVEGETRKIVLDAEAYAQQKVLQAVGETQRFLSILKEYETSPEITEIRLKIETLEEVLPKAKRIILLSDAQNIALLNFEDLIGGGSK